MEKRKVYIVNTSLAYREMFLKEGWEIVDNLRDADLVQFTGGEDVSPYLYHENNHPTTGFNITRDLFEKTQYDLAQEFGIACAGICRGGQFLNVMNGGKMYQDVDGHARSGGHVAFMYGYMLPIWVSSTHHQMIRPNYEADVHILMTAKEATHKEWMGEGNKVLRIETPTDKKDRNGDNVSHLPDIESVYYPDSNTLCFQPHPEFQGVPQCRAAYFHLINNYLFDEKGEFELKKAS